MSQNQDGDRVYGTPWNSIIYESYSNNVTSGQVLVFDYFSDGTTLSKAGTQVATFVRLLISNFGPHSHKWYTVRFMPSTTSIPSSLTDEWRRTLQLQLFHRFLYLLFNPLISASLHGSIVNGVTYFPRHGMIGADQPEESSLLCLKRHDSDMDCTHFVLP